MIVEDQQKHKNQKEEYKIKASELGRTNVSYNSFFGLEEPPFSIAPNPRFLYMSEYHQEALAHLLYGVSAPNGFVLLTGEVGTGKTTVIRAFLQHLPDDARVAYIVHAKMSVLELLETIAEELNIEVAGRHSARTLIQAIHNKLLEHYSAGYRTYLLIDEAQNLEPDVLEEIRLLTNLETDEGKLLHIILVGQSELRDMFQSYELRQLNQRITARYHLHQLSTDDVTHYVQHRLAIAKAQRNPFTMKAMKSIGIYSKGIPRLINVIADRALLAAFSKQQIEVDHQLVKEAAKEVLGRVKAKQWTKTANTKTEPLQTESSTKFGFGTKLMITMIVICILGLAAGPYLTQWWKNREPVILKNDIAEAAESIEEPAIQPVEVAPADEMVQPQNDLDARARAAQESAEVYSQNDSLSLLSGLSSTRNTLVETPEKTQSSNQEPSINNSQDGSQDGSQLAINAVDTNTVSSEIAAVTAPQTEDTATNIAAETVSKNAAPVADSTAAQQPAQDVKKAEEVIATPVETSDKTMNSKTITSVMTFEQALLKLKQMSDPHLPANMAANILTAGCNGLEKLGCLELNRSVTQLLKMETPFIFKLAPGQMRPLGLDFDPSASGLTRNTWFLVSGYNKNEGVLDVQSQNWKGQVTVADLDKVFMERGYFLLETPVKTMPQNQLLDESYGPWIIQHIGFADGSRLDPTFDIIVSKETLASAVKAFQKRRGVTQDGLFGSRTLVEVNRELDPNFPKLNQY